MPRAHHGLPDGGYVSAADFSAYNLHVLLVLSAEGVLARGNAATDNPIGTLQNLPASGGEVRFTPLKHGEVIPMIASAVIAAGAEVTPTTTGRVVTNDGTAGYHILGIAEDAAGADGDLIGIRIDSRTEE